MKRTVLQIFIYCVANVFNSTGSVSSTGGLGATTRGWAGGAGRTLRCLSGKPFLFTWCFIWPFLCFFFTFVMTFGLFCALFELCYALFDLLYALFDLCYALFDLLYAICLTFVMLCFGLWWYFLLFSIVAFPTMSSEILKKLWNNTLFPPFKYLPSRIFLRHNFCAGPATFKLREKKKKKMNQ